MSEKLIKRILLPLLILIIVGGFSLHIYRVEKVRKIKVNIVFDYLELNGQLSKFWSKIDEVKHRELPGFLLYFAESVKEKNSEFQDKYRTFKDIKIDKTKTIGEFLASVDSVVSNCASWMKTVGDNNQEMVDAKFKLMEDAFFDSTMYVLDLIAIKEGMILKRLTVSSRQRKRLMKYIDDVFGKDITYYTELAKKPVYLWGILVVQEVLKGEQPLVAIKKAE